MDTILTAIVVVGVILITLVVYAIRKLETWRKENEDK